jgi:tetratricopeptide (TPR) repeat protein
MRLKIASTLAVVALTSVAPAADDVASIQEKAVDLYDRGKYEDARTTLEELDRKQALDGPLLYRLFFCEKAAGRADTAQDALERARSALERELAAEPSLEVAFYLANAYGNLGRASDAQRVAHDATAKIESGALIVPKSAIAEFQVGKLYQDEGRSDEACAAYRKAVDGFDLTGGRFAGNARWALRYLGINAFDHDQFAAAEKYLARLAELGGATAADWDTLAAARVRLGSYGPAAEAWKASVKLNPAESDDANYASKLAQTAAVIAPLPASAPGGTLIASMSQGDLESFLKSRSEAVTAALSKASAAMQPSPDGTPARALPPKLRAELTATLLETRKQFVAAGLEYAVRRFGIRETAFREGYAVLVFQDRAWELPPDPDAASGGAKPSGS